MSSNKKKKKRRHGCGCLSVLLCLVVICVGVFAALRLVPLPAMRAVDAEELKTNGALPDDWLNIMLLGADSGAYARSDTMMIASIHRSTGEIKLTSIMRDTYVPIEGHGKNKINTATHFGGVDLALKTVNQSFGMNVSKYAMVDFSAFAYIVEALGGVDVPVSEAEMQSVNQLMQDMRVLYPEIELAKNDLTTYGDSVHLDGMQALAYARIRKLDSDYNRTSRQRTLIKAIAARFASPSGLMAIGDVYRAARAHVETNLTTAEVVLLGAKAFTAGFDFKELRLPVDGTYSAQRIDGQDCLVPDLAANEKKLFDFIYGSSEG